MMWFMWAAGTDLDGLIRFSIKSDYYILDTNGLALLYFVMALVVFLLNSFACYYLWRPARIGYKICFWALLAGAMQNVVTIYFALKDIPAAREAYARGRELRGLPVRESGLDIIFTEQAFLTMGVTMLALYLLVGVLIFRDGRYFYQDASR